MFISPGVEVSGPFVLDSCQRVVRYHSNLTRSYQLLDERLMNRSAGALQRNEVVTLVEYGSLHPDRPPRHTRDWNRGLL
jgi:hypothetical protein